MHGPYLKDHTQKEQVVSFCREFSAIKYDDNAVCIGCMLYVHNRHSKGIERHKGKQTLYRIPNILQLVQAWSAELGKSEQWKHEYVSKNLSLLSFFFILFFLISTTCTTFFINKPFQYFLLTFFNLLAIGVHGLTFCVVNPLTQT